MVDDTSNLADPAASPAGPATSENLALIRRLFTAFGAGDRAALHRIMTADVHWVQAAGFPGGASYVGPDAVIDGAFGALARDWSGWAAGVHEMFDTGDAVVVLGEYRGTHRASGRSAIAPFAHVYRLRDGRIARFEQHTDTHVLAEAARGASVAQS